MSEVGVGKYVNILSHRSDPFSNISTHATMWHICWAEWRDSIYVSKAEQGGIRMVPCTPPPLPSPAQSHRAAGPDLVLGHPAVLPVVPVDAE